MPVGLERVAWGMMASYSMDCECQFSLNALNYNLVPPYKKQVFMTFSFPVDHLTVCLFKPCISDMRKCNAYCFSAYRCFRSEWLTLYWKHYRNSEDASQHTLSLTNDTILKELTSSKIVSHCILQMLHLQLITNSIHQVIMLSQLCTVSLSGGDKKYVYKLIAWHLFLKSAEVHYPSKDC